MHARKWWVSILFSLHGGHVPRARHFLTATNSPLNYDFAALNEQNMLLSQQMSFIFLHIKTTKKKMILIKNRQTQAHNLIK